MADRYRIERELGRGGMATVYLAEDLKPDRKVAIKVLSPELAAVVGAERFLSEIKTTANLQHPHVLPLHDSGQVNGTVFYVMPYIAGESVRERLTRDKQMPVEDAVRIAREVADFGIALAASTGGSTRMTETGMSLGTPHYMSAEQAMGERTLGARSDIYALGCALRNAGRRAAVHRPDGPGDHRTGHDRDAAIAVRNPDGPQLTVKIWQTLPIDGAKRVCRWNRRSRYTDQGDSREYEDGGKAHKSPLPTSRGR